MPELNVQQKILTFATSFGVTYLLLDLSRKVLRETFKILGEAFDNNAGEEEEVFDNNDGEEEETRTREIARRTLEAMEQVLIRTGLLGEEDIRRIRGGRAVRGKTD